MADLHQAMTARISCAEVNPEHPLVRRVAIGVISFLTLIDLFAAQAILPKLAAAYHVSPSAAGFAVNSSTIGMAAAGILVALVSDRIDRRRGIVTSLTLLSIPTALLALQPDLATFTALRIVQGVFMSAAFTLTLAYLAENAGPDGAAAELAAYVTGNVASNLVGRFVSAALTDHFGLATNFLVLAGLNLAGAALVLITLKRASAMMGMPERDVPAAKASTGGKGMPSAWLGHLRNPALAATFGIGFLILFAFIGTFTYVNFVLVRAPLSLGQMSLGFVYFVFLPALILTPLAGSLAKAIGPVLAIRLAFSAALIGLPLLLLPSLPGVLAGLALVGAGTFAAQAIATGFVGRLAASNRGAASGLYLAAYYLGGLAGTAVLGRVFDTTGWTACVAAIGISLALALALTTRLAQPSLQPA